MRYYDVFLFFVLFSIFNPVTVTVSSTKAQVLPLSTEPEFRQFNGQNITESKFNQYYPDGNVSILLSMDRNLFGEGKYFSDENTVKNLFDFWLAPFGNRFDIKLQIKNVTFFTPGENDSLDISINKVADEIGWNMANSQEDPAVNGNNYDFLIIYQEYWRGGRNRANAIHGNALIVAHEQPLYLTTAPLMLIHEVGHIFGGEHYADGYIPPEWYGSANLSIMSYDDLFLMRLGGFERDNMPIDDHNFEIINSSRYRFDKNDADLDGLPNYYENRYKLDPCVEDSSLDSDNDGLTNWEEYIYGTHPLLSDSDGDLYSDWAEHLFDSSPLNSTETPIIPSPVLYSLIPHQMVAKNQPISLQWRGAASIRDYFTIYQNNTKISAEAWNNEYIEVVIDKLGSGNWNFTCRVYDTSGKSASASIWITIPKDGSVNIEFLFLLFGLLGLVTIYRKNR